MPEPRPPRPPRHGEKRTPPPANAARPAPEPEPAADAPLSKQFPCEKCGAELNFRPGTDALECPYCGHANAIPESSEAIVEQDYLSALAQSAEGEETQDVATVKCETCGAEIDKPPSLDAFPCPFCGSNIIATAISKRLIKPQSLLPFGVDRDEARARYRKWLRSLWFAPNALAKEAHTEMRLNGVYVPYWTYDARTTSSYSGERGEYYYVTVGTGKNRRTERRTRWYPASGVVWNTFDDILVLASRSLPQKCAEKLEPWDLHHLTPYDNAYVSGFTTQAYQVDLAEGFGRAADVMKAEIRQTVRRDIGGDTQRIYSISTQYDDVTYKHILLPIWISAYRYRERTYRFLVNARTGEVQGERPWSWIKITLAVLAALAVIGTIAYFYLQNR